MNVEAIVINLLFSSPKNGQFHHYLLTLQFLVALYLKGTPS